MLNSFCLIIIGAITSITGGQTYLYPNFHAERDGVKFAEELRRCLLRPFGFDGLLRVRCSNGLRVVEHFGNFYMKNSTDVEFGYLDSETAFAVQLKHDGKLDEHDNVYFQIALLYTTAFGQRRIRVLNSAFSVTPQMGNVFRCAEMDAIVNYISKAGTRSIFFAMSLISSILAIPKTLSSPLKTVRDNISDRCVSILAAYRKHCASTSAAGQLILPESCKLFPLYALTVLKNRAFRSANDISSDSRVLEMRFIRGLSVSSSINYFYPRMFSVFNLEDEVSSILSFWIDFVISSFGCFCQHLSSSLTASG